MKIRLLALLVGALLLSSCTPAEEIEAHNAWARPTAAGENAAVYFQLHNHTETADALTGVTSTVSDAIEIHETRIENDVMQMKLIDSLPLGADEEVIFKPGGYHLMLTQLKQDLVLGHRIGLVLHFQNHPDLVLEVHIEASMPDDDHAADTSH